jgi:hypothetical protein
LGTRTGRPPSEASNEAARATSDIGRDESEAHLGQVGSIRECYLRVAIVAGVLVATITEGLSALGLLTFWPLILAWVTIAGPALCLVASRQACPGRSRLGELGRSLTSFDLAMGGWIVVVTALTGVLAVFAVPTNWDSMVYHLARVAHWVQNESVAFYPTAVVRQLYLPPWAEYAVLHLFIVAQGDRLANLPQWGSMIGSLVGVSLIARQLGADARGQILSSFVCATIPMGIMQSSTTQNDYVVAFWLVCLVSALMSLDLQPGLAAPLAAGAALGLALLTKGTANIFAAPFVVYFVAGGRGRTLSVKLKQGLLIAVCALTLNAPHYARNLERFGFALGPGGEGPYTYTNQEFSLPVLLSNVLRNLALHAGTPWRGVNTKVEQAITAVDSTLGIAPDDPRSTWPNTRFAVIAPIAHEDLAGNGFHLLLVAAAGLAVLRIRSNERIRGYAGCLVVAFLLFCLLLRWQPWHSRLHLPLFVLGAPLAGLVFERLNTRALSVVLLMLAASSWYFLTGNTAHPLSGPKAVFRMSRTEQRLAHADPAYLGAARFVKATGCSRLGLAIASNDPEYVLWALLPDVRRRGRMEHVSTGDYGLGAGQVASSSGGFQPCAIIRAANRPAETLRLGDRIYQNKWSQGTVQVLVRRLGAVNK